MHIGLPSPIGGATGPDVLMTIKTPFRLDDLQSDHVRKAALWFRTMSSVYTGPFGIDEYELGIAAQSFRYRANGLEIVVNLAQLPFFRASDLRYDQNSHNLSAKCIDLIQTAFNVRFDKSPFINTSRPNLVVFFLRQLNCPAAQL